jgi:hypothetical protein
MMLARAATGFRTPSFRYGALEHGLAAAFGVGPAIARGALRSRLKKFGLLGLPGDGPGTGTRRLYSLEQAMQLLLAILVVDAGIDPVVGVPAIKRCWPNIRKNAERATDPLAPPIWIMLRLQFIKPWVSRNRADVMLWISVFPRIDPRRPPSWYAEHRFKDESDNALMMLDRDEPGWCAFRNLSKVAQAMQTALKGPTP